MAKKILIAMFKHETNVFCPLPADRKAFRNRELTFGEDVFTFYRGVESEVGAFLDILEGDDRFALTPTIAFNAPPSGPVTAEVYDLAVSEISKAIREQGPFDGILLSLHGAMVAEGHCDGEGDLIEIVRGLVGKDTPIIVSLDLHANITEKMARCADALVTYEGYPHTDTYATGIRAAELMRDTMTGDLIPTMGYRRIPYLLPMYPTNRPEIAKFHQMGRDYAAQEGVAVARVAHGFFPADIAEMGMSAIVVTHNDKARAQEIADAMAEAVWAGRDTLHLNFPPLDTVLDEVAASEGGTIVLADSSDNPGGGALSDTTHILRRILERGITGAAVATILDPASVDACEAAGVGNTVDLKLGGWSDPAFSGGPVAVTARVVRLTDGNYRCKDEMERGSVIRMGKTAVVEIAGNLVIIASLKTQPWDMECFRSCGITPEDMRLLVLKSAVHYQASYGPIAKAMYAVCLPGYVVPVPDGLTFKNWPGEPENL